MYLVLIITCMCETTKLDLGRDVFLSLSLCNVNIRNRPKLASKQPIRTHYLGHVTGNQPIRDEHFLIRSVLVTYKVLIKLLSLFHICSLICSLPPTVESVFIWRDALSRSKGIFTSLCTAVHSKRKFIKKRAIKYTISGCKDA